MRASEFLLKEGSKTPVVENTNQAAVDALMKKYGWSMGRTANGDLAFTWQGSKYEFFGERVRITLPDGKSISVVWDKKPDWQGRGNDELSFAQAVQNKYLTFDLPIWQALNRGQLTDSQAIQKFKAENERQAREAVAQGVAADLTEVVDLDTAFPLKWDQQFAAQGEIHAAATDADGREIGISFTPAGNGEITDVAFTRGGTHEMTGKGDAGRVMATVIKAINIYANKYKPPYLAFSAKSSGGRASAYAAMIRRYAQGYELLPPDQYPAALGNYLEFIGTDQPFVLVRT